MRWADAAFPGRVEVQIVDADGTAISLADKVPVFGDDHLSYPVPVQVAQSVLPDSKAAK